MHKQTASASGGRENYYRILVETAADAIITTDESSVIVSANPAAADAFGYTLDEMIGMSMTELMPERFREAHRAGMQRYLATGRRNIPWRGLELPGLRRDGREILLEVAFAEQVEGGRRFFTGTMRDITDRKRNERLTAMQHGVTRVLAESRRLEEAVPRILQSVVETLAWDVGGFWTWDDEAGALRAMDFWVRPEVDADEFVRESRAMTLVPGEGLPGRVWASLDPVCIRDVGDDPNFPRLAVAGRAGLHGALAFPVCVGRDCVGVMEFLTRQVPDTDVELLAAMEALGSDIGQFTRRMQAEERLRRREEVQRFLSEMSATLAASVLDYDATLRRLARLAVPVLGDWCTVYLREEGGTIRRLEIAYGDPALAPVAEVLQRYPVKPNSAHPANRVMDTGEPQVIAEIGDDLLRDVAQDEEHLRSLRALAGRSALVIPLRARGRTLGAILLISAPGQHRYADDDREVAEEFARRAALAVDNARLYQESLEANRAKSEFLAVMSHELRTPLNAVIGYADLLRTGVAGEITDTAEDYAQRIGLAARHLTELIEEVLTFSRLEAGRESISPAPVLLQDVLDEIRAVAEPLAQKKEVRFTIEAPDAPTRMTTDARKVRQIVLNLVDNALKFTHQGEVRLSAEVTDEEVVLRVRDTGIGITPEDQERIFEPFWQVQQGATRETGGTGLGLSVSSRLAQLLGGEVAVQSALGEGSTFTVRLPLRLEPRP